MRKMCTNSVLVLKIHVFALKKRKVMLVVSSREFRANQRKYFDLARTNDVVITSRSHGSYRLVPVMEDDTLIDRATLDAKKDLKELNKKRTSPLRVASFINRRCFYRYWTAICLTVSGCWAFSFLGIWMFSTPCSTLASIFSASASSGSRSVCWNFS